MIRVALVLCLTASSAFAFWEKGLRVRFDVNPDPGNTSYFVMPENVSQATEKGWQQVEKPDLPHDAYNDKLELWCPKNDYSVCLLFDDTEYVAGLQIAFNPNNFIGAIFDWATNGYSNWTVTLDGKPTFFYVIHQYYISSDSLATDPDTRIANRNKDYILQEDSMWVDGFHGELFEIPTSIEAIETATDFTKQSCIVGMGQHYYYKMTDYLTCAADTIFPWFPLTFDGQYVGIGILIPGKYTIDEGKTNWFEAPPRAMMQITVYDGPECVFEYGDDPGMVTMHTYFIKDAHLMSIESCQDQESCMFSVC